MPRNKRLPPRRGKPKVTVATPIEDRIKRRPEARRTRQRLNREFGAALELRGAVKKSRLKKLVVLAANVPGYTVPEAALVAQAPKKKAEVA